MDVQTITQFFVEFGPIAIFVIVLLEYMNLPGFPAGVIMPLAGIWAAQGKLSFLTVMLLTTAAGLVGSMILYYLGRFGGDGFFHWFYKKWPKQKDLIESKMIYLGEKGAIGVFLSKLLPCVRTLISIPAGMVHMNLVKYVASSTSGIIIWNLVFVGAGYFFGDAVIGGLAL